MAGEWRKQRNKKENLSSKELGQRFWTYVWTIKLIVLLIVFIVLFIFVRRFIFS